MYVVRHGTVQHSMYSMYRPLGMYGICTVCACLRSTYMAPVYIHMHPHGSVSVHMHASRIRIHTCASIRFVHASKCNYARHIFAFFEQNTNSQNRNTSIAVGSVKSVRIQSKLTKSVKYIYTEQKYNKCPFVQELLYFGLFLW